MQEEFEIDVEGFEQPEQSAIKGSKGFRPGLSGNPLGRPLKDVQVGDKSYKQSKLRKVEKKLLTLNPKALDNIKKSIVGEAVDKETLATSKWVVTTTAAVSKQAMQEEIEINGLKDEMLKSQFTDDSTEEDGTELAEFQLSVVPTIEKIVNGG